MRIIITAAGHIKWLIPLLPGLWLLGKGLLHRVHTFLRDVGHPVGRGGTGPGHAALWGFMLSGSLVLLSPAPVSDKISALLFLSFLLQLGATDAVSGYLPVTFTGRFMLAGALDALAGYPATAPLLSRLGGLAIAALLMMVIDKAVNRHAERFGRGDLWLIAAFSAWTGFQHAMLIALAGLTAFICWHASRCIPGAKEGPLGPWLCISGGIYLLVNVYKPVWIIVT